MKLIVNGTEAYAYTGGKPFDPALPCVVFLHGALNDHSVWTLLARWFAHHGHGVLAPDLPGHGRSAGAPLASIPALGAWVGQLLEAAGVRQPAALVGHSMGSLIALEAAAQAPERSRALALVGTAYPMKVSEALLSTAREQPERAIAMVNSFSFSGLAAKPAYPGPGAWLQGGEIALKRRIQGRQSALNLFEHDFRLCDGYTGGLEAAAKVRCPTRLILGERDQMTAPKQTAALVEALAAVKPQLLRLNAGHSLMAEAPDAMLRALRELLGA
ncbi:alpha/beta hydrolase [Roseateles sp. DAIF2]|uniref:alpha/beta fold hydrolase n=1 Tax=Roseateles sp. DAIF2 TaxID=2714952 RepID=UPI0018A2CC63|nr:alpha/beta hydrolase [Roseateles sp. DAIF2]QPF74257.1 alpha/beta hydrolase [Roseateles sp. DAIF2]